MRNILLSCAMTLVLTGCATAEREAFDPDSDPRIGAAVKQACFSTTGTTSGGPIRIGSTDAFVTGTMREKYLLIFSPGCGDIGTLGSVPVFRNYGQNCRRVGERVEAASSFGVTGACVIKEMYEWNPRAEDEAPDAEEDES